MKKVLLVMMALVVGATSFAATTEVNDTTVTKSKKNNFSDNLSTHLALGINVPTNVPDGMSIKPFRSWDIMWTVAQYDYSPKNALQTYSAGIGIAFHNYGLGSSKMFVKDANGVVGTDDYPANTDDKYSRLHVFSISMPFLFTQKLDRQGDFRLSVGPVVNFNVAGHLTTGYEQNDVEHELTVKGIDYRPVTVDLMGIIDMKDIGLFVKYSPMSVLKTDRGPQFHSLAFGLYF